MILPKRREKPGVQRPVVTNRLFPSFQRTPPGYTVPVLLIALLPFAFPADPPAWERREVVISATPPPAPRGPAGTIDVELTDAELPAVFRFLAETGGVNFVVDDAVKGTVTLHLRDVTWDDALNAVLATKGLWISPVGATTWVVTATPPVSPPSPR